jgi:hypothetical protein
MPDIPTTHQIRRWCAKGFQDSAPPEAWDDQAFMAAAYRHGEKMFDAWLAELIQRTATGQAR